MRQSTRRCREYNGSWGCVESHQEIKINAPTTAPANHWPPRVGLASARQFLEQAMARLGLSARAYHRVLKVARTIADLGGAADIAQAYLAEAIQYRCLDRDKLIGF
ncbi:MAG: hypothetical protein V3T69_02140 [Acidiferrobacterales bacterium]